jgi:hypothetical protein
MILNFLKLKSDGFTTQAPKGTDIKHYEDDKYENTTIGVKTKINLNDEANIGFGITKIDAIKEYDSYNNPDDPTMKNDTKSDLLYLSYNQKFTKHNIAVKYETGKITRDQIGTTWGVKATKSESSNLELKDTIKYNEKVGDLKCGTNVGWIRANQLCKGRNISTDTIARMASFKRHQQHKDMPYDTHCGGIMWDAWGGDEGVNWAIRKLDTINRRLRLNEFGEEKFTDIDYEKRIVSAPVMLAETAIPRYNPEIGKYFVKFKKDTIFRMMKKYLKENKIHNVNTNHNPNEKRDGVYMIESYIVDDRNQSKLFPEIPEGSWVATFAVENDEVWNQIKSGEYTGFSLEGMFIEKYEDELISNIEKQIKDIVNGEGSDMTKEDKIKKLLNIK